MAKQRAAQKLQAERTRKLQAAQKLRAENLLKQKENAAKRVSQKKNERVIPQKKTVAQPVKKRATQKLQADKGKKASPAQKLKAAPKQAPKKAVARPSQEKRKVAPKRTLKQPIVAKGKKAPIVRKKAPQNPKQNMGGLNDLEKQALEIIKKKFGSQKEKKFREILKKNTNRGSRFRDIDQNANYVLRAHMLTPELQEGVKADCKRLNIPYDPFAQYIVPGRIAKQMGEMLEKIDALGHTTHALQYRMALTQG